MEEELVDVLASIRACLVSAKDPVPLRFLARDYDTLAGGEIPYRKFSHPNVESFLRSLDSLEVLGSGRDATVIARRSAQSKHMTELIGKTPKPKPKKPFRPNYLNHYQPRGGRGGGRGYIPRGGGRGSSYPYRGNNYHPRGNSSRGSLGYAPTSYNLTRNNNESQNYSRSYSEPTKFSTTYPGTKDVTYYHPTSTNTVTYSPEEPVVESINKGYDPSEREPSPEDIVIKVEANDKRKVVVDNKSLRAQGGRPTPWGANLPPRLQKQREQREFKFVNLLDESAFLEENQETPQSLVGINGRWQHDKFDDTTTNPSWRNHSSSSKEDHRFGVDGQRQHDLYEDSNITRRIDNSSSLTENVESRDNQSTAFNQMPNKLSRLAPRFQNLEIEDNVFKTPVPTEDLSKNYEETLQLDFNSESNLTCPYGPSDLLAAGRRKQQQEELKVPDPDEIVIMNNTNLLQDYLIKVGFDEPVYSFISRRADNRKIMYMATVKINQGGNTIKTFSSYPEEHPKEEIARGYAAKTALVKLREEEKVKNLPNIITANCDENALFDRINQIVAGAYNGVFAQSVEQMYIEKFNECLPEDWIETLRSCPTISVEPNMSSFIIVPKDPNLQMFPPLSPTPQIMEFPPEDSWNVYVTSVINPSCVNLLIVGENYSDLYNDLSQNMIKYYKEIGSKELALNIERGNFYAAEVADDSWHRVLVSDIDDAARTVTAWLIDHGDNEEIRMSSLYRLPREFCELPIQCVQCELEGLERFAEDYLAAEIVANNSDCLVDKTLVANVTDRNIEGGYVTAVLYDTSGTDDVNVNEVLKDAIIYGSAEPEIPHEGHATEVYVVSISRRGEVFLQIPGPSCQELLDTVAALSEEDIMQHKLTSYRQMKLDNMYLAKYSVDNNWYRAKITSTPSLQRDKLTVRFVDFGNEETVSMSDIASVDHLPTIINKLPPQAVRVALHNLPLDSFSPSEIAKLKLLLLDEQKVILVKTIKIQEDPPLVEIFYKNEKDDNALVSVNNTIYLLYRQQKENTDYIINNEYGSLLPDLQVGKFVPVQILLAANPSNFWFRHLQYLNELESLMVQMAYAYENTLPSLSRENIIKGELYAAQYDDEKWYRVLVTDNVTGSNVPVRLVDFGDMNWVPLNRIRELEPSYRKLPFMAIKGKLAGIRPVHQDWSVQDCMTFQKLTETKLAAIVKKIERVKPMETVISLILFNTNSGEDISIAQTLIDEKRAVEHL